MTQERLQQLWQRACQQFSSGNFVAAGASCEAILADVPTNAMAHWMLSSALRERGSIRAATRHAIAAGARTDGMDADNRLRIAWSLILSGEAQAATSILTTLAAASATPVGSRWELARQLALLDQHQLALETLDTLAAAGARAPAISHMRGTLLAFQGRQEAAASAFEDALGQDPGFCLAHWSLVQLNLPQGHAATIDRMRRAASSTLNANDTATMAYALFKVYDELDDTQFAWQWLEKGMQARRLDSPYDAPSERRIHERLMHLPTLTPSNQSTPITTDAPTPIFIVGLPRTGTTLLERILGNHPDVQVCGELTDLALQHEWICDRPCPDTLDVAAASNMATIDAPVLGSRYLSATAWRARGRRFFSDKNPANFIFSGLLPRALPQAKVIHIARDPLDACFSNLKMLFAPGVYPYSYALRDVAAHFSHYDRLMRHNEIISGGQILHVDYEALVSDPSGQALRILDHCGLQKTEHVIDMTRSQSAITTASRQQVREPIHQRNIGGWRRYAGPLSSLEMYLAEASRR